MPKYLLAIDQGTTGSTALVVATDGSTLTTRGRHTTEFPQHFPKPGWVEHEPAEIWASVQDSVAQALLRANVAGSDIAAIGITNQRETTVVWDADTGKPIHRAIVWQCRRTASICDELRKQGVEPMLRKRTGLVLDAYFSGTKISWILDNVAGARGRAEAGKLRFGTIDSFLVHQLSGGEKHVTDVTNASRTLLMDLETLSWDEELLALFRVPRALLPTIVQSAEVVGTTRGLSFLPDGIPIAGMAGDQQAALFGQACFDEGSAKCTYGTGAFALMNIGAKPIASKNGLVTTVAWKLAGKTSFALEGSAFIAGAAVQWLRDGLGIIQHASEMEALARTVESSDGVAFVPALAGLGAPYWDQGARGAIVGLTRGTTRAHIARATLEGIAFEVEDLLEAMSKDAGHAVQRLRVDGGATANALLMELQANYSNVPVERPAELESTGRGAAMLAGVGAGICDLEAARTMVRPERVFQPNMVPTDRAAARARWREAVARVRSV